MDHRMYCNKERTFSLLTKRKSCCYFSKCQALNILLKVGPLLLLLLEDVINFQNLTCSWTLFAFKYLLYFNIENLISELSSGYFRRNCQDGEFLTLPLSIEYPCNAPLSQMKDRKIIKLIRNIVISFPWTICFCSRHSVKAPAGYSGNNTFKQHDCL